MARAGSPAERVTLRDYPVRHFPAIRQEILEELVGGEEEPLLAAEVLEPIYQDLAEWRKLIAVLEVKLKANEADGETLYKRVTELALDLLRGEDPDPAAETAL